jgi:hypothetical protein
MICYLLILNENDIQEWLVDRKRIPNDWNKELQKLEKEVSIAKNLVENNENLQQHLTGECK